jgi:hypothetical protein
MDVTVSSDTSKPELCSECAEAGCEPTPFGEPMTNGYECQRTDAYGDESDRSCGCGGVGIHGVGHGDYPED